MQFINLLLLTTTTATTTFISTATGGLVANTSATPSPDGEEVHIQWHANDGPPTQICTPFDISHRDDNCYPQIADCQNIYDQYVNFSNSFCLDQPAGATDFGTLITSNTCMIQVSLISDNFSCAAAPDIADKIHTVLDSSYKSPDGKGVWTSFGSMKCPDGHYIGPVSWMEWYIGCTA